CGLPATGNFCSGCGTTLAPRSCPACQARLSAQARFCHRCGHAVPLASPAGAQPRPAGAERTAWIVAAVLCVLLLGAIALKVMKGVAAPAAPDMANAGAAGSGAPGGPSGPAPDISRMTPRDRFDRLFNRIMQAADQGDTVQIQRFLPMALGAYAQLDSADVDARYHAAVLHLQGGDAPGAMALADTILAAVPAHLFGYVVRGEAARLQNDSAALARAQRDFLAHYDAEMKSNRVEYQEHEPAIAEFKKEAEKGER
ncbi:MAG: zinc ribbon domain-containing protein, partial [Gemmatimonadales bacterium]